MQEPLLLKETRNTHRFFFFTFFTFLLLLISFSVKFKTVSEQPVADGTCKTEDCNHCRFKLDVNRRYLMRDTLEKLFVRCRLCCGNIFGQPSVPNTVDYNSLPQSPPSSSETANLVVSTELSPMSVSAPATAASVMSQKSKAPAAAAPATSSQSGAPRSPRNRPLSVDRKRIPGAASSSFSSGSQPGSSAGYEPLGFDTPLSFKVRIECQVFGDNTGLLSWAPRITADTTFEEAFTRAASRFTIDSAIGIHIYDIHGKHTRVVYGDVKTTNILEVVTQPARIEFQLINPPSPQSAH